MKKKRRKNPRTISHRKEAAKPTSFTDILRATPKGIYVIVSILLIAGILSTSYGIFSFVNRSDTEKNATVDVKGEVVTVNEKDKNITVKYDFKNTTYTVILDHYEAGMKTGDTVNLKVNPNELTEVLPVKALIVTVFGVAGTVSAISIFLHTVLMLKKPGNTPNSIKYTWIVCVCLAFASCGLGVTASLAGKAKLGMAIALVFGAIFIVIAWITYIVGNKKSKSKR